MDHDSFPTTRWSLVQAAADENRPKACQALESLCTRYWTPLYAYARRRSLSPEAAEDVVQGFFVHLLEKDAIRNARRERGRFRSFLLTSFKHFLSDQWDRARAQKRGGTAVHLSLDLTCAEAELPQLASTATPESAYERRWALATIEHALAILEREYADAGRERLFQALGSLLTVAGNTAPHRLLGEDLGMTEGAVKVAAHRLRRRYRSVLRRLIADTVSDPNEIEGEIHFLLRALSAGR
jgi:RNA polymerase sigma factor (sigma-70 family)